MHSQMDSKNNIKENVEGTPFSIGITEQDLSVSLTENTNYVLERIIYDPTTKGCYIGRFVRISNRDFHSAKEILGFKDLSFTIEEIKSIIQQQNNFYINILPLTAIPISRDPRLLAYLLCTGSDKGNNKLAEIDTGMTVNGTRIKEIQFCPPPISFLVTRKEVNY